MNRSLLLAATLLAAVSSAFAQDWAKARIEKSPRHLEWVTVKHDGREVGCYVGYPEVKDKATAVIVIHEIYGLSDWARSVCDELAEAGYIAIAPDLLWGLGAKGGGTSELNSTEIGQKIRTLSAGQITADLNAVADYVTKLPAANGRLAVIGFCWGGGQSFSYATNNKNLKAAFVCYGTGPTDAAELSRIACPVYGFYGGNDARVTTTTDKSAELMKAAGKTYERNVYDGAGHGFMRAGEAPAPTAPQATGDAEADKKAGDTYQKALVAYQANRKAHDAAWVRVNEVLGKM